jgi:hypothetical protein
LIPIMLFDFLVNNPRKRTTLLASVLVALFHYISMRVTRSSLASGLLNRRLSCSYS